MDNSKITIISQFYKSEIFQKSDYKYKDYEPKLVGILAIMVLLQNNMQSGQENRALKIILNMNYMKQKKKILLIV